jgi:SlyX protein|nr:SlyX family protein [Dechloromonas denitrificans]
MNTVESRLTDIEIKISYTEDMVDELNRTIFRQQQQIDRLITEFRALREQVQSAAPTEQRSLRDDLPPHY